MLRKKELEAFVEDLKTTHGSNLVSVILYGSAATNDVHEEISDYDLLVVLHRITPEDLQLAHAAVREWQKMGHLPPIYFTASELKDSADVFPIDFHQMENGRVVLFGEDVLADVKITDQNLRHQIEYELRGRLTRLRKLYIVNCTSSEKILELMVKSLSSFTTLFRASLILQKISPPVKKREIIEMTAKEFQINKEPFLEILRIREEGFEKKLDEVLVNKIFASYLSEIESFTEKIDKL